MADKWGLTLTDRFLLRYWDLRKRFRKCPECGRRGYGGKGYRWVDDRVVQVCGFETAPIRCNTCGQKNPTPHPTDRAAGEDGSKPTERSD